MRAAGISIAILLAAAARAGTLEDMDLRRNVEAAIRGSAATATLHLKIEVVDRVAVPEGIVRNLAQADDVVERASTIKGILAVDRTKMRYEHGGVADEAIASRVSRTLSEVQHLASSAIRVDVAAGVVTLEGEIKSAAYRAEVRRLCASIDGVLEVQDRLVSPEATDEAIQKALDGIFGRRVVPRFPGSVETLVDRGIVVLSGTVPRLKDRNDASRSAWAIGGVRRVVDDLRIDSPPKVRVIQP